MSHAMSLCKLSTPGTRFSDEPKILRRQGSLVFYMHPWEIDPDQPRVREVKSSFRFRHYVNLQSAGKKLKSLISAFADEPFMSCRSFIAESSRLLDKRRSK
jgi:hypothetical protein